MGKWENVNISVYVYFCLFLMLCIEWILIDFVGIFCMVVEGKDL